MARSALTRVGWPKRSSTPRTTPPRLYEYVTTAGVEGAPSGTGAGPPADPSGPGAGSAETGAGVTVAESSPESGRVPVLPSFTANRSAKSHPMTTSTVHKAGSLPKFRITRSSRMPWPT